MWYLYNNTCINSFTCTCVYYANEFNSYNLFCLSLAGFKLSILFCSCFRVTEIISICNHAVIIIVIIITLV